MKKKILIVDDELFYSFIAKQIIERSGVDCEIRTACNGHSAFDLIMNEHWTPDVIFLDINMPLMNGFQFLEKWETTVLKGKENISIALLTSSEDTTDLSTAKKFKIDAYLIKPLTKEMVVNFLN
jgi:YesN/AraC family two-component response regulator